MIYPVLGLPALALAWLGLFWLARELAARHHIPDDWRLSWLFASVAWGGLLTIIVEMTSAFDCLNAPVLACAWSGSALLAHLAAFRLARRRGFSLAPLWQRAWAWIRLWQQPWAGDARLPLADAKLMLGISTAFVVLLFVIAVFTPTSNWDSLSYHLPRMMHWMQQQSVAHYPTHYTLQIEYGPWAGYAMTTLHLLAASDRLINLVQWFAMLTSLVAVAFIARDLAARWLPASALQPAVLARVAAFSVLLLVTLPIGMVECVTTQNDYNAAAWLACLVAFLLALLRDVRNRWLALGAGLALSLGILNKSTMYLYAAPVMAIFGLRLLGRLPGWRCRAGFVLVFVTTLLALNLPHYTRNYRLFQSPIGSPLVMATERNQAVSVGGTASSVLRNLFLHVNTGYRPLTKALHEIIGVLHVATGRDLNDPATTFPGQFFTFTFREDFVVYDSHANCPWHLALILAAGLAAIGRARQHWKFLGYAAIVGAAFLLLCALLPWKQWNSRLHIALFVLLVPWASVVLVTRFPRWFVTGSGFGVVVFAVVCLIANRSRPITDENYLFQSREQQYLVYPQPVIYEPLCRLIDDVAASKCGHVGLHLDPGHAEYPFWVMLRNRGFAGRLDHQFVENVSGGIARALPAPDVVIGTRLAPLPAARTNLFPFITRQGNYLVYWSDHASRWAELAQLRKESVILARENRTLLSPITPALGFNQRHVKLQLHTVRPGALQLKGRFTSPVGQRLRIQTNEGLDQSATLENQTLFAAIATRGGTVEITLTFLDLAELESGSCEDFHWEWLPSALP